MGFKSRHNLVTAGQQSLFAAFVKSSLIPLVGLLTGAAFGFTCLAAYIWQSQRSVMVPYLVTVDSQGAVLAREELSPAPGIPDRVLAVALADFVEDLRTRGGGTDSRRLRAERVYAQIKGGSPAFEEVNRAFRGDNPLVSVRQVAVQVQSVIRMSSDSFRISWKETLNRGDGSGPRTENHALQLSYEIGHIRAADFASLRLNPLGLKIRELTVNDEFETHEPRTQG